MSYVKQGVNPFTKARYPLLDVQALTRPVGTPLPEHRLGLGRGETMALVASKLGTGISTLFQVLASDSAAYVLNVADDWSELQLSQTPRWAAPPQRLCVVDADDAPARLGGVGTFHQTDSRPRAFFAARQYRHSDAARALLEAAAPACLEPAPSLGPTGGYPVELLTAVVELENQRADVAALGDGSERFRLLAQLDTQLVPDEPWGRVHVFGIDEPLFVTLEWT